MKRLIHATGTWQIIMAASALRQEAALSDRVSKDYLVLSAPRLFDEIKQIMLQIASAVWSWQAIIWAEDLLDNNLPNFDRINFPSHLQAFRERVAVKKFDELWVCKLPAKAEKIIVETYASASIVIYEDGLQSYVPYDNWSLFERQTLSDPKKLKTNLAHRVKGKLGGDFRCINHYRCICLNHINRISKVYFFLGRHIPVPIYFKARLKQIENQFILQNLEAIYNSSKMQFAQILEQQAQSKNLFLVLGQCFSEWKLLSWEEELEIYSKIFSILTEHNFTLLWKEHPRMTQPFYKELTSRYSAINPLELNLHFSWPIELFVKPLNLVGCVSITSTSLFYLKDLFDIPTYTFATDKLESFINPDFFYMSKFVSDSIAPFELISTSSK